MTDLLPEESNFNPALPVVIPKSADKAEIDLILRQLFMLKQDTELIQKILVESSVNHNIQRSVSKLEDVNNQRIKISEK